jgi:hypothetical protein
MCTERKQNRVTDSLRDRFVAVCRHTCRTTSAVRFWRVGGVSLVVAGMMGMTGELAAPRAPALAALLSGSINLADVGGTVAGATFNGIANYDHAGISLSTAGDVNGDGRADLLIGADFADAGGTDRGQSYLVYGQPNSNLLSGQLDLANVGDTLLGGTFNGIADSDHSGVSVSGAGDVNGDGLADLLIGADFANVDGTRRGQSYLVYGRLSVKPLSGPLDLANVGGTLTGATFNGIADFDNSGFSVSIAGDVNGDRRADLLIGAYKANAGGTERGQSYLVYGRHGINPLSGSISLGDVGGAVEGATFNGIADYDHAGFSVSTAGDVNGDGLADLLIGAKSANVAGSERGQTYLVYGRLGSNPLSGSINLGDVGGAVPGATFNGTVDYDHAGVSVSAAGDVNGDGRADLLIGADSANAAGTNRGETYLVYGQPTGNLLSGPLDLADVGGKVAGATFNGIADYDNAGVSVSGVGDVNGDGLDDLLIGADFANVANTSGGQSYLIYGRPIGSLLSGSLDLADVGGMLAGATFNGISNRDNSGVAVSGAGDINGDGLADLLIGATTANGGGIDRGQGYLVYGQYGSVVVGNSDYNDNGTVDAADYTVWQDNLGGDSAVLSGNGSGSSTVVQADYDLWKQNFGNSVTVSGQALPEPSSLLLELVLAVAAGLRPRGRALE